jgi:dTDP-4-amino-4,6-dideoxygalactose transaminase
VRRQLLKVLHLVSGDFTPFLKPLWTEEDGDAVSRWLAGEAVPDAVERFEDAVRAASPSGWSVRGFSSGRAAIQIALEAMRLPPASEILLPSFSCAGVILPVLQAGHRPVLVDVDECFNTRFESVLEADSPSVRAIILPHLSGCFARETVSIVEWARTRRIWVIEDLAQAYGVSWRGIEAGTLGDVAVFSTGIGKPLFAPGGGWLAARDPQLARYITSHPTTAESRHEVAQRVRRFVNDFATSRGRRARRLLVQAMRARLPNGPTADSQSAFRLGSISDIDAELARLQVGRAITITTKRRTYAEFWRSGFRDRRTAGLQLLPEEGNVFAKMLLAFPAPGGTREAIRLRATLEAGGIETEASYVPLHLRPPYTAHRRVALPVTERLWSGAFSVPVRPNLVDDDLRRIDAALTRWRTDVDAEEST